MLDHELTTHVSQPIYAQAKEFAEGVHAKRPGHWLSYSMYREEEGRL